MKQSAIDFAALMWLIVPWMLGQCMLLVVAFMAARNGLYWPAVSVLAFQSVGVWGFREKWTSMGGCNGDIKSD